MKLRCPYCKQTFEAEAHARCPHCGKMMLIPSRLLPRTFKQRKRDREQIRREAERRKQQIVAEAFLVGRRPGIILFMVIGMIVLGALLIGRSRMISPGAFSPDRPGVAQREADVLLTAVERFRLDCGRHPSVGEGLHALLRDPGVAGWRGPYIRLLRPDPWHKPYVFRVEATNAIVRSRGPDGIEGTPDDIVANPPRPEDIPWPEDAAAPAS